MNQKSLKKIRALIRSLLGKTPERGLTEKLHGKVILVPDYSAGLNADGTPKSYPFQITGTLVNSDNTQRAAYRQVKKFRRQTALGLRPLA